MQESDEDSNSSSGNQYEEVEPERSRPDHKIPDFVNAFQGSLKFGIRTTNHLYMKHYTHKPVVPVKRSNETYMAWHFVPAGRPIAQECLRLETIDVEQAEKSKDCQLELAKHILERIRSQRSKSFRAVVLHGMEFAMIPRNIRMLVGDTSQLAIVVQIDNVDSLLQLPEDSEGVLQIVESLFFTECLVFSSYTVLEQFLGVLEKLLLQFSVKSVGLSELVIISDFRPFYVRVTTPGSSQDQQELTSVGSYTYPDIIRLPIFQPSDEIASSTPKSITESFQKSLSTRMVVFSFGQHESLELLLNYRGELNHLSQSNLIYVFTPNSLSTYVEIMNQLPQVVFISATYMQVYHQEQRYCLMPHNRRGQHIFPRQFMDQLKKDVEGCPGISMRMRSNLIYLRLEENCILAKEFFEKFLQRVEVLVRHYNETSHQSLIVTRMNTTTVEVRQFYQTKMFLTNLIFKFSSASISFMALFMVNRFENFKYFRQLRHVLEVQMSLSRVRLFVMQKADLFGYVVTSVKTERADVINQTDLLELLKKLIACEGEDDWREPHRTISSRSPIFGFKNINI